jgi:hypothetical protein
MNKYFKISNAATHLNFTFSGGKQEKKSIVLILSNTEEKDKRQCCSSIYEKKEEVFCIKEKKICINTSAVRVQRSKKKIYMYKIGRGHKSIKKYS